MENKAINAIRFLGIDAINKANSGHPGIVLGAAPTIYTLFTRHMNINVKKKDWINRDRFILSAGHGSSMLYAINHLIGYKISIDDLKNFRQIGNTPGHPEYLHTEGVEMTSGPLGQGVATSVGFAIAEAHLAARFNKDDNKIIDHYTYVLCGDGDLQEGVALEAMSLAGHLGLSKLIVLFDSNDIQLDGSVSLAYSEDHKKKFEAMGWQYIKVSDGNNIKEINKAIVNAKKDLNRPTLIEIKTIIGFGSINEGTSKVHGSPIGIEDANNLRKKLNYEYKEFEVPSDVYSWYKKKVTQRGKREYNKWLEKFKEYQANYPNDYLEFQRFSNNDINLNINEYLSVSAVADASRNVSGKIIDMLSAKYKNIIGGSADLTSSTKAKGADGNFSKENRLGRNINFGVREHAMAAITNGIVLHGLLKGFCGGFFVFSDYMKPAIRLSAIMKIPSIFVFTHDSIAVGEDGPTHEPIEQLVGLRAIPNFNVIRPADGVETLCAWKYAIESKDTPCALILTRQNLPLINNTKYEDFVKGAYIIAKEEKRLDGILLASGSEVSLAIDSKKALLELGVDVRVVSMPSNYLFDRQTIKYQKEILPKNVKTLAIEMGSALSWYKYTNNVLGIDTFGISAPAKVATAYFGFTKENVVKKFMEIK